MKSPKEKLEEILESINQELDNIKAMLINDPHNGTIKNNRLKLLEDYQNVYEQIKRLEDKEQQKAEKEQTTTQHKVFPEQLNSEINSLTISLRSEEETERLLSKMTLNKLIYSIEKNLSGNHSHFDLLNLKEIPTGNSYTYWYFKCQALAYSKFWDEIDEVEFDNYPEDFLNFSDSISEQNSMIRGILPRNDDNSLSNRITTLENFQRKMETSLISYPSEERLSEIKTQFCELVKAVERELKDLSILTAQYNEN